MTWWERFRGMLAGDQTAPLRFAAKRGEVQVVEIISADRWARFEDGKLVAAGGNSLGAVPLGCIQSSASAFAFPGAHDVVQLVPLQGGRNTRRDALVQRIYPARV